MMLCEYAYGPGRGSYFSSRNKLRSSSVKLKDALGIGCGGSGEITGTEAATASIISLFEKRRRVFQRR
jgi:hypothetical protein